MSPIPPWITLFSTSALRSVGGRSVDQRQVSHVVLVLHAGPTCSRTPDRTGHGGETLKPEPSWSCWSSGCCEWSPSCFLMKDEIFGIKNSKRTRGRRSGLDWTNCTAPDPLWDRPAPSIKNQAASQASACSCLLDETLQMLSLGLRCSVEFVLISDCTAEKLCSKTKTKQKNNNKNDVTGFDRRAAWDLF